LRLTGKRSNYDESSRWRDTIIPAAECVLRSVGLEIVREYLRLDVAGYVNENPNANYWDLKVAVEAENDTCWEDELVKLCHVVADTRVLIIYRNTLKEDVVSRLVDYLTIHRHRVARTSATCRWLFLIGPYYRDLSTPFAGFTLDGSLQLRGLPDDRPVRLADFAP
jgi:hypothetical protein